MKKTLVPINTNIEHALDAAIATLNATVDDEYKKQSFFISITDDSGNEACNAEDRSGRWVVPGEKLTPLQYKLLAVIELGLDELFIDHAHAMLDLGKTVLNWCAKPEEISAELKAEEILRQDPSTPYHLDVAQEGCLTRNATPFVPGRCYRVISGHC